MSDLSELLALRNSSKIKTINSQLSDIDKLKARQISFSMKEELTVEVAIDSVLIGFDMTIAGIILEIGTAPTGADVIIDINKNGTSLYTTQANRPTIVIGETTATAVNPDITSLAAGDVLTFDIDQIGSTIAGSNLAMTIICEVA